MRDRDEHAHTLLQAEVLQYYDAMQCFDFIVAKEATSRLCRNINMKSAGFFYKDQQESLFDQCSNEPQGSGAAKGGPGGGHLDSVKAIIRVCPFKL